MGWFSSLVKKIKKVVKAVVRAVRAIVRIIVKIIVEIIYRLINLLFFWLPVQKKLRIQVMILLDEIGTPTIMENDPGLLAAVNDVTKTYKDRCNIKVISYGKPVIQTIRKSAPKAALDVDCDTGAFENELGEAGVFFSNNMAGWNLIPISFGFPITIFVVRSITGKIGCSLGSFSDYVTVSPKGATDPTFTIAHEIGHSCSLLHRNDDKKRLMFPNAGRSNNITGWQKFVIRNSRHCTFW